MNELPQAPALIESAAERTEEVVARVLRATRDEKIKLDTQVATLSERVDHLDGIIREQANAYRADLEKLNIDRDQWQRRATQLETELRSLVAAASAALNADTKGRIVGRGADDGEPAPSFLTNARRHPADIP